jgi:nucleosome binding factor SPN SPT16 subunit
MDEWVKEITDQEWNKLLPANIVVQNSCHEIQNKILLLEEHLKNLNNELYDKEIELRNIRKQCNHINLIYKHSTRGKFMDEWYDIYKCNDCNLDFKKEAVKYEG